MALVLPIDIQCVRTTDLFLHCQPMSDCYVIVIIPLIGQTLREMKFLDGISITET